MGCTRSSIINYSLRKLLYSNLFGLYPNCHYKDTYGFISLWARETNQPFYICKNSLEDVSLKNNHVLDVSHGEEGFINDIPFIHHGGRGATRTDNYYHTWIDMVTKYLKEN